MKAIIIFVFLLFSAWTTQAKVLSDTTIVDTSASVVNIYKNFAYAKAKIRVKQCGQCVEYTIKCYQYFDRRGRVSYYRDVDTSTKIPTMIEKITFGETLILVASYQKKW